MHEAAATAIAVGHLQQPVVTMMVVVAITVVALPVLLRLRRLLGRLLRTVQTLAKTSSSTMVTLNSAAMVGALQAVHG